MCIYIDICVSYVYVLNIFMYIDICVSYVYVLFMWWWYIMYLCAVYLYAISILYYSSISSLAQAEQLAHRPDLRQLAARISQLSGLSRLVHAFVSVRRKLHDDAGIQAYYIIYLCVTPIT